MWVDAQHALQFVVVIEQQTYAVSNFKTYDDVIQIADNLLLDLCVA